MGGHNTARAVSPRFEVRPPDHKRLKAPPSPRSYNDYLIATHGTASPRGGQSGFIHDRSSGGLSPRRPERVQLEKLEPLSKGVLPLLEPPPRLRASQGTNLLSQPRQPVKSLGPWRPPFPRVPLLADMPPPATPVQMYLVRPLSPSRKLMATDPAAAANPEGLGPPAVDPVGIVWQGVSGRRRERLRAAIPRAELRGGAPSAKSRAKLDTEGESIGSSEAEGADAEVRPRARPRPRPRSEAEAEAAGFLCWAGAGSLTMPTAAELLLARCVGTEAYHRCVGTPAELRQGMGPGGRKGAGSPRRAKSGMESPPEAGAEAGADGGAEAMTESMTWQTQKAISGLEAAATVIEASEEFVAARVASARCDTMHPPSTHHPPTLHPPALLALLCLPAPSLLPSLPPTPPTPPLPRPLPFPGILRKSYRFESPVARPPPPFLPLPAPANSTPTHPPLPTPTHPYPPGERSQVRSHTWGDRLRGWQ